jgi:integrase
LVHGGGPLAYIGRRNVAGIATPAGATPGATRCAHAPAGRGLRHPHRRLLGHADVRTTMIYIRVLNRSGRGIHNQFDLEV